MDSEEKFGRLKIESSSSVPGWDGPVPYLDYWTLSYRGLKLNDNQERFYRFIKRAVERGEGMPVRSASAYLYLLRDEILQQASKTKTRQKAVLQAKHLIRVFNFNDTALLRLMSEEGAMMAERRLNRWRRGEPARWVPLGQEVEVDGRIYTRGGFYLGTYLPMSAYDIQHQTFVSPTKAIEGPVVNLLSSDPEVDLDLLDGYSTFIEMPKEKQDKLLDFLAGDDVLDYETLMYYIAGIEHRLLADAATSDTERIALLRHINDLAAQLEATPASSLKPIGAIKSLIHFCLARFFYRDPLTVIPDFDIDGKTWLNNSKLQYAVASDFPDMGADADILIAEAQKVLAPPVCLPDVYHEAYRRELAKMLYHRFDGNFRASLQERKYAPVSAEHAYHPSPAAVETLVARPLALIGIDIAAVDQIVDCYAYMMADLQAFKSAVDQGKNLVVQSGKLPQWCNAALMPGLKESIAAISPTDSSMLRCVPLIDVLETIGFPRFQPFTGQEMRMLNIKLQHLGLCVANLGIKNTVYPHDGVVCLYPSFCGEMSKRGTLPISLVLVAWMITADKATEADFAVVDAWLRDIMGSHDKAVPAIATLRWLTSRKLVMTVKRKVKAATLGKFVKRRDELVKLLLSIVADPERATPKRMKRLETIYTLVGLDPAKIHSDMHRIATDGSSHSSKAHSSAKSTRDLDRSKLRAMAQSTIKAQEILAEVFVHDDAAPGEPAAAQSKGSVAASSSQIASSSDASSSHGQGSAKDTGYSDSGLLRERAPEVAENPTLALLRLLINKTEWQREEFARLCAEHGDTAGSMLERLNDLAYDLVDEPVAEDADDIIYIDAEVAEKLLEK